MTAEHKYPIGIQTFSEIIQGGLLYVDKTDLVWQLAHYAKYVRTQVKCAKGRTDIVVWMPDTTAKTPFRMCRKQ